MELKSLLRWDWKLVATLAALVIAAFYIYFKICFAYWKRRGFPEVPLKPLPFFGHTLKLLLGQKNFTETFHDLYKYAGDRPFVGYFHGSQPTILLRDPETIKHVLVKDFHAFVDRTSLLDEEIDPLNAKGLFQLRGKRWKEMRARLSPTFTSGRMKAMFPLMLVCAEELNESLSKNIEKNEGEAVVEIKEYMECYSTDVIATCAFGIRCDALNASETSEFRRMGKRVFEFTWRKIVLLVLFLTSPKLLKWTGLKFTDDVSITYFSNLVKNMTEQREKAIEHSGKEGGIGRKYGDFIYHLVLLKKRGLYFKEDSNGDEAESNGSNAEHISAALVSVEQITVSPHSRRSFQVEDTSWNGGETVISSTLTNAAETEKWKPIRDAAEACAPIYFTSFFLVEPSWTNIDNDDLTAQVMFFFSAGFEPTSSLLSFALFELSVTEHGREIQKKLREEIDRVMEEEGRKLTYEGLKNMHLLDRVISETLRIYPPAGILFRTATQPYIIPGTTHKIKEGTQLVIPLHSMQLDERFFPNPKHFDPDRFLPENKENIKQFSYLPFGDGPRVCIGERFAQMQSRLGLASVLSRFEFEVCREKTDVPMKFKKRAFVLSAENGVWVRARHRKEKN